MNLTIGISLGTFILGIIVFIWRVCVVHDKKIGRVYKRLDEVKEYHGKTFISKESCGLIRTPMQDDLKEIKQDLKKLLYKEGIK